MRIAYFDCFAGASGDMILGALLDAGLDQAVLAADLAGLNLPGWRLDVRKVNKNGFAATRAEVVLDQPEPWQDEPPAGGGAHGHGEQGHHSPGEHGHHGHGEQGHHGRGLREIEDIIRGAGLPAPAADLACAIFRRLAVAEATVHGTTPDAVHFHEVGAVDSIVDTVGAALALHRLGVEAVHVSPINTGRGLVRGAHGLIPVPGPATLALLAGVPVYSRDIPTELLTPTGAAVLTTAARGYGPLPAMTVAAVGYGAGKKDLPELPNLLRVVLGEAAALAPAGPPLERDTVAVLEANLDDMNPELFQHVLEALFAAGALDVFVTPVQMKKNRPGAVLTVLGPEEKEESLAGIVLRETTSIGVRSYAARRRKLERTALRVETPYGPVAVKVGRAGGAVYNAAPEYEDCRQAARRAGVPLKEVYQAAVAAAWQRLHRSGE